MAQKDDPGKTPEAKGRDADARDRVGDGSDHDAATEADAQEGIADAEVVGETRADGTVADDPRAVGDDPVTPAGNAGTGGSAGGPGGASVRIDPRLADASGARAVTPGATVRPSPPDVADMRADDTDGSATTATAAAAIPAVGRTTLDRREEGPEDEPAPMARGRLDDRDAAGPTADPDGARGPEPGDVEGGRRDPVVERVVERRGPGFVPLLLGGLLAGAIGWAAGTFLTPMGGATDETATVVEDPRIAVLEADLAALRSERPEAANLEPVQLALDDVSARLVALEGAADEDGTDADGLVALRGELDALRTELAPLGEEVTGVADGLGTLAERVAATDGLPDAVASLQAAVDGLPDAVQALRADVDSLRGTVGDLPGAVDGLRAELEGLPGDVEALRADVEPRMAAIEARLAELNETAQDAEAEARALAREAARNQLQLAVEAGDVAYSEPLGVLGGDPPAALADHADEGVPTLTALQADFPPLARGVLRVARQSEDGSAGLRALLTTATNARSLSPRDGDDADAVLSRAEAALREGDLETALRELQTLPTEAQAELGQWLNRARVRLEAERALHDYLSTTG